MVIMKQNKNNNYEKILFLLDRYHTHLFLETNFAN
jgi:hypothetical protein